MQVGAEDARGVARIEGGKLRLQIALESTGDAEKLTALGKQM